MLAAAALAAIWLNLIVASGDALARTSTSRGSSSSTAHSPTPPGARP
jgi:hypothetical protein